MILLINYQLFFEPNCHLSVTQFWKCRNFIKTNYMFRKDQILNENVIISFYFASEVMTNHLNFHKHIF